MHRLRKFSLKIFFVPVLTAAIFLALTQEAASQRTNPKDFDSLLTAQTDTIPPIRPDSLNIADSTELSDSLMFGDGDSLQGIRTDTFNLKLSADTLEAPVRYYAEDSAVVLIRGKKIILYGQTKTEYETVSLSAPRVEIDQETQILTAFNSKDSLGVVEEYAKFTDGEQEFTSDTIFYNFKTQRGLTRNTITQQGEIFVHGEYVKKYSDDVTFVKRGFFTTCNLDDPHFGFRANRLKVVNKKLAISGPAHPEFEGVPIPVWLPFGFYPLSSGKKSGLLPPQLATNDQMGLGLEGLGYYFTLGNNDYWDLKVYGNLYSYGSWMANANPTYRKRYRYSGSLNFGLQRIKRNFKGDPDFSANKGYSLTWNHSSDSRARPGTSFSANVNTRSTTFNENVPNNPIINYSNQLSSSITYSKTWVDKPFNFTASANHSQNNQTRLVNVNLPDLGFTVSTLYPFQKKDFAGTRKWYEQLGVAYNGNMRNQISFYDTAFRLRSLVDTLQWGAQHNIPITLALPAILDGAVVVSPSISYSQVWLGQALDRRWNSVTEKIDTTIEKGFYMDHRTSFGLSFNTALFGTYFVNSKKVYAVRHTVRPTIGINYQPDLSKKYFYTERVNVAGDSIRFGRLTGGGLYSGYSEGENGGISFQLDNNLEMKMQRKDSTETEARKVRLIEGFGISGNYNFLADSMKLSNMQIYFRSNILEKINITASANLSPYKANKFGQDIAEYAWEGSGFSPGRITSGNISLSTSFQSKPRDEEKAEQKQDQIDQELSDPTLLAEKQRLLEYMQQNPSEFVDFNIPWQFSLSYSMSFSQQPNADYTGFDKVFYSSANFNGSFSLTPKWKFSVNGFYDFTTNKLQTFSMAINREMHCWQMAINVTPLGIYRFFNISISPKSSILQDLRINRTRSFYTGY